jgi:hypothetical protein
MVKRLDIMEFDFRKLESLVALKKYAEKHILEEDIIMEIGYNTFSGYVYIAYEGGLTLAIFEGRTEEKDIIIFGYDYKTEGEIEFEDMDDFYEYYEIYRE